jgi:hypothetical protein
MQQFLLLSNRAVTEQCWQTERNNERTEKNSPNRTDGQRTSKIPEITERITDGRTSVTALVLANRHMGEYQQSSQFKLII